MMMVVTSKQLQCNVHKDTHITANPNKFEDKQGT